MSSLCSSRPPLPSSPTALHSWRSQALGEHEFGRLLDAYQALHDLRATVTKYTQPLRFEGQAVGKEGSQTFRKDLAEGYVRLLRATVGLDAAWGEEFKRSREAVNDQIDELAHASRRVFEDKFPIPGDHHLLGFPEPHEGTVEDQRPQIAQARSEVEATFQALEDWLAHRLTLYAVTSGAAPRPHTTPRAS